MAVSSSAGLQSVSRGDICADVHRPFGNDSAVRQLIRRILRVRHDRTAEFILAVRFLLPGAILRRDNQYQAHSLAETQVEVDYGVCLLR